MEMVTVILESEIGELELGTDHGVPYIINRDSMPKYIRITYELMAEADLYQASGMIRILGTVWAISEFRKEYLVAQLMPQEK